MLVEKILEKILGIENVRILTDIFYLEILCSEIKAGNLCGLFFVRVRKYIFNRNLQL